MEKQLQLDLKGWLMLFLVSLMWGGSFLFVEVALRELPPITIVMARVSLAAVVCYLVMKVSSQVLPRTIVLWKSFFVLGLLNNVVPFTLLVWGQQFVLGSVAAILNASIPVSTVILAQIFTDDEKLSVSKIVGIGVALVGVMLVIGLEALSSFSVTNIGQGAILLAGISYAAASVYGRRYGQAGIPPLTVTTGQLIVSSFLLLPIVFIADPDLLDRSVSLEVGLALAGLAIVSTSIAFLLYFKLIATVGATNTSLVTMLVPISAIFLLWAILGQQLPEGAFPGMAAIAAGLFILDGRPFKWAKSKFEMLLQRQA